VKQRQSEIDRRHDTFMASINKSMDGLQRSMEKTSTDIGSIHGHITRCRDEMREEIERDFMTKTEGERIRGSISKINTKIHMTGLFIVFALSLVQIGIAVYT